jgi:hypothetical protein
MRELMKHPRFNDAQTWPELWPGPAVLDLQYDRVCAACHSSLPGCEACGGEVFFCLECMERSKAGDFPEYYREIGGGD